MFTGLIEAIGEVTGGSSDRRSLRVRTALARDLRPGDSLAVNGVCLTVARTWDGEIGADVGPETARITTVGGLRHGQRVNLERPLRADSRLGGHVVQGHVDGMGRIEEIRRHGDARWVAVSFPPELAPCLVRKGSIAVDGISLTVADLDASRFMVMIVPFTWEHTNLRDARTGDRVNLECDVLGKYVARGLELAEDGRARRSLRSGRAASRATAAAAKPLKRARRA